MTFLYHKKFLKDLAALPGDERKRIERFVFIEVLIEKSFREIRAEKLQGYKNYYKFDLALAVWGCTLKITR